MRILRSTASLLRRCLFYRNYDSAAYWKGRAGAPSQAAVLWKNQEYNDLYRLVQRRILERHLAPLPQQARVLDIGCGIGVVSRMIIALRSDLKVDAVDFPEMIRVARSNFVHESLHYVESSAEEYHAGEAIYDAIISSACYSAIRDIGRLEKAMVLGATMLKPGGVMIMIDPFHRWNFLARAKYATRDVVRLLTPHGLVLEEKSGVLFWPFREWLANSGKTGAELRARFEQGERLLRWLGAHFWGDYKILVFRKAR